MDKKETDISLIRKYLNGELDTQAMHRLERRAQDDPFLMDALEGYEKTAGNQQVHLDELTQRLQQHVARKERRIIPFNFIAIAASVLIILTIGGLWFYKSHQEKREVAQLIKPEVKTLPSAPRAPALPHVEQATLPPSLHQKHFREPRIIHKPVASIAIDKAIASTENKMSAKDTMVRRLSEITVIGYATQRKKDIAGSVATISIDSANKPAANAGQLLQGRVAGVTVLSAAKPARKRRPSPNIIKGKVVGKDDGLPIVGASVRIAGTNIGAVTDVNGTFSLSADSAKTKLDIAYIGYNSRRVDIRNRDSLNSIALQPASSSLNEVVVTGYTSQPRQDDAAVIDAHPQNGWNNFKKYLKENAVSPDGKSGVVRLSMSVAPNGTISDIKVEKGVSTTTDQKAIDLIKDGPAWLGSTSRKIEKVRVRIKFTSK